MTRQSAQEIAARDGEWAARIRTGDVTAFESLVVAYYARLLRFGAQYTGSKEAAEDIIQDVFSRIWERHTQWTLTGSEVRNYLYKSIRNRALDLLKHNTISTRYTDMMLQVPTTDQAVAWNEGESSVDADEFSQAVERTFADLPERAREIFRLSRDEGLTYRQIADVLGISSKAVEKQMGRVLKALHRGLEDWDPGQEGPN